MKPNKSAKLSGAASGDANKAVPKASTKKRTEAVSKTKKAKADEKDIDGETEAKQVEGTVKAAKRKREAEPQEEAAGLRRSTRARK